MAKDRHSFAVVWMIALCRATDFNSAFLAKHPRSGEALKEPLKEWKRTSARPALPAVHDQNGRDEAQLRSARTPPGTESIRRHQNSTKPTGLTRTAKATGKVQSSAMTPEYAWRALRTTTISFGSTNRSSAEFKGNLESINVNGKAPKSTHTQKRRSANTTEVKDEIHAESSNVSDTAPASTQVQKTSVANATEPKDEIHLRIGSENIVDCMTQSAHAEFGLISKLSSQTTRFYRELHASKGSVVVQYRLSLHQQKKIIKEVLHANNRCVSKDKHTYCCALRIRVPEALSLAVKVRKMCTSRVQLEDAYGNRFLLMKPFHASEDSLHDSRVIESSANVITIVQYISMPVRELRVHLILQFQALPKPGLQVRRTAINRGVVETPWYEPRTVLVNRLLDPWAIIRVIPGHVTMTSCASVTIFPQCLKILAGDNGNETIEKVCPDDLIPRVISVHTSTLLHVHLYRYLRDRRKAPGVRMDFSFHNQSALPMKLPDHSWNCSVPYRHDFLYHMSCNLRSDCRGAEDEWNCSYSSDQCGPGYLTLGGACFFYAWRNETTISSAAASEMCSLRGGRLAILNTESKWKDAIKVLPFIQFFLKVFVGIGTMPSTLPLWYIQMYRWDNQATAFYFQVEDITQRTSDCPREHESSCGYLVVKGNTKYRKVGYLHFRGKGCTAEMKNDALCENKFFPTSETTPSRPVPANGTKIWPRGDAKYVECPLGHYTQQSLACDVRSSCWSRDYSSPCKSSLTPLPPSFTCLDRTARVPYTLVCDQRSDCVDSSDEDFCSLAPCLKDQFSCDDKRAKACDGWSDCFNREDEHLCDVYLHGDVITEPPPAIVNLTDYGRLTVRHLNVTGILEEGKEEEEGICPDTHFQCLTSKYCLPWFLRCNGVFDCPGNEDEKGCDTCPGFYRCRDSSVCLHHSDLCDGRAHCPHHDDELTCDVTCPSVCVCRGLAFFCRHNFTASAYPQLRFLDASGSAMAPLYLTDNHLLIYLSLANCGIVNLDGFSLPNLLSLDIHDNMLTSVRDAHLLGLPQLRELSVAGNPLALVFTGVEQLDTFGHVHKLDLSRVVIHVLDVAVISAAFPNLHDLNLSHSGVQRVLGKGFQTLKELSVIDLRGCPMKWFPRDVFQGLHNLQLVHGNGFKVCCPTLLPNDFNVRNCFAPRDEISSCGNLLRRHVYSVCVFVLSFLALFGNAISFIFKTNHCGREKKLGYGYFVTHLSASDFLMGVYLAIVGVADRVYHGAYVWEDERWKHSFACKVAGFLSLLSSEVSAFILCLITLDRFLVLRFPFSRMRFHRGSAHIALGVVWLCGVVLASVPLLPATSHWEFYSQTGICIPLPITRSYFAGYRYSFGILIIFNCVVFVFISFGQLFIYWSVRVNSMSVSNSKKKAKDLSVARRLVTVVMSDFLCWFPIGILGMLASGGVPIPGDLSVAVAIFVLPLNSAVNPYLYTFNVIMEHRYRAREEKLRLLLLAQFKTRG